MKLIFATANAHKLAELQAIMPVGIELTTPVDHGLRDEIPENEPDLEGNARAKSIYVYERLGMNCFADDTGLEVTALDGEPGVYSARYAGLHCSFEDNVKLLLSNLERRATAAGGVVDRRARFRTVISLIIDGTEHQFQGQVWGHITEKPSGGGGFGYDPIFMPDGYDQTFAQMEPELKNRISHRALAVQKLIAFLSTLDIMR